MGILNRTAGFEDAEGDGQGWECCKGCLDVGMLMFKLTAGSRDVEEKSVPGDAEGDFWV